MKTYVITVSKVFLKGHVKAGMPTNFEAKIKDGIKSHTMRLNIDYWLKIIEDVNNGQAFLSVRQWVGQPYKSKQEEIIRYYNLNYNLFEFTEDFRLRIDKSYVSDSMAHTVSENDGLSYFDLREWFGNKPCKGIIIHFRNFKY